MIKPSDRLENYHIIKKSAFSGQDSTDKILHLIFLINGELESKIIFFKERPNNVDEFRECLGKEIGGYQLSLIDSYRMRLFFFSVFDYEIEQLYFNGVTIKQHTNSDGEYRYLMVLNCGVIVCGENK